MLWICSVLMNWLKWSAALVVQLTSHRSLALLPGWLTRVGEILMTVERSCQVWCQNVCSVKLLVGLFLPERADVSVMKVNFCVSCDNYFDLDARKPTIQRSGDDFTINLMYTSLSKQPQCDNLSFSFIYEISRNYPQIDLNQHFKALTVKLAPNQLY